MAEVAPIAKVVQRSTSLLAGGGEVDPAYDDAAPRQWTVEHIDEPTGNVRPAGVWMEADGTFDAKTGQVLQHRGMLYPPTRLFVPR